MSEQWYVLGIKRNKEQSLMRLLKAKGYMVFYPCQKSSQYDTYKGQLNPIFPGYLFIRLDLGRHRLSDIQCMPNTTGIVQFGEKPAFVPEPLVQAIQKRVSNNLSESIAAYSTQSDNGGDEQQGEYLQQLERIFDPCIGADERLRELLDILDQNFLIAD